MESVIYWLAAMAGCAVIDWFGNRRIRTQLRFLHQRQQELTKAHAALRDTVMDAVNGAVTSATLKNAMTDKAIVKMDGQIMSLQTTQIEVDRILPWLRDSLRIFKEFNKTY